MNYHFENREEAGRLLAEQLSQIAKAEFAKIKLDEAIILALPRGGVPTAYEIAKKFKLPLEVLLVRKIGAPFQPESGIGVVVEEGYYWIDQHIVSRLGITSDQIDEILQREMQELRDREQKYRGGKSLPSLVGRTVVLVDDGLATGVTARVSAKYIHGKGAKNVILAIPACAQETASILRQEVAQVICLIEAKPFYAVGFHFKNSKQVSDEEVIRLLSEAKTFAERPLVEMAAPKRIKRKTTIDFGGGIRTKAILTIPESSVGIVIFAHGSGSTRLSPRNQRVADELNRLGIGTLLFDLLTENESQNRSNVFDIPFLAHRLVQATKWLKRHSPVKNLPIGYFGASTGGGAALSAAAELKNEIRAVVSRGGRPDLAIPMLSQVNAATLLIVGGEDTGVIELNQQALKYLKNANLILVPGATHLFEEPGALEQVSQEANIWFLEYFEKKPEGLQHGAA